MSGVKLSARWPPHSHVTHVTKPSTRHEARHTTLSLDLCGSLSLDIPPFRWSSSWRMSEELFVVARVDRPTGSMSPFSSLWQELHIHWRLARRCSTVLGKPAAPACPSPRGRTSCPRGDKKQIHPSGPARSGKRLWTRASCSLKRRGRAPSSHREPVNARPGTAFLVCEN